MLNEHLDPGRLIRVAGNHRDPPSVAYVVAVQDSAAAVALVTNMVGAGNKIEDRGNVSAELLHFLQLKPGQAKALARPAAVGNGRDEFPGRHNTRPRPTLGDLLRPGCGCTAKAAGTIRRSPASRDSR